MDEFNNFKNSYCIYCSCFNISGYTHKRCFKECFIKQSGSLYYYSGKLINIVNKKEKNLFLLCMDFSKFILSYNIADPVLVCIPSHISDSFKKKEDLNIRIITTVSHITGYKTRNDIVICNKKTLVNEDLVVEGLYESESFYENKNFIVYNNTMLRSNFIEISKVIKKKNKDSCIYAFSLFSQQKASLFKRSFLQSY